MPMNKLHNLVSFINKLYVYIHCTCDPIPSDKIAVGSSGYLRVGPVSPKVLVLTVASFTSNFKNRRKCVVVVY